MDELALAVDPADGVPLHRQLYERLRQNVLAGRLAAGARLPSTRRLAETLGVARNTVAHAYDDLLAEGYLEGRRGSGTYVSRAFQPPTAHAKPARSSVDLSDWARRALGRGTPWTAVRSGDPPLPFDFQPGTPDWDAFPRRIWRRLLGRRLRAGGALSQYGDPAGFLPLRQAIAEHLAASRAVVCQPEQVVIVNGTQQAIDLLARLLIGPGDEVVVEDPGYPEARLTFGAYGASVLPVPVDAAGLRADALPEGGAARLVYVTPSHQFPTGVTMSLERRLRLLEWAEKRGALVLEDDYDSEFRYAGTPVESLQGLDRSDCVVYLGTFSTVLFRPLRIGYVVLPAALVAPFVEAKWLADRGTGTLDQQTLADFLREGHYARHLRRMRRLGRARRDALLGAIASHLGELAYPPLAATGMHVMLRLREGDERRISLAALERGVGVYPAAPYYAASPPPGPALLLGFGALTEDAIAEGIRRLSASLPGAS